jgi:ferredoxin
MAIKIKFNKDDCTGCGSCAAVCDANWEMGDDGKAKPKKTNLKEVGCNKEAADVCPVQCITVVEE